MAIDLGVSNLATCITTDNESFIIDGKYLKSINQFYNKQKAHYQSLLPKNIKYSKRIKRLDNKSTLYPRYKVHLKILIFR
mgnify:CR=1 FL=1